MNGSISDDNTALTSANLLRSKPMAGADLPNEASVEVKALLPLLTSMGFGAAEVSVQKSFSLRLGRQMVLYNSNRRTGLGRLDYLIANANGVNLFVVEVKHSRHPFTLDDRDQGISYARLVDPIAPFVVLYSGDDVQIFDTITRLPLTLGDISERSHPFWSRGFAPDAESWKIRYEALQAFLGYSTNNVRQFCRQQQAHRMDLLKSTLGNLDGKYIPEVYVEREHVVKSFSTFTASTAVVFAIGGSSGVGKTNAICALAERSAETHLSLFFNGTVLYGSLKDQIAEDFAWTFTEDISFPQILGRLDGISKSLNCRVLLFLDAIDEITTPGIELELSDLADRLGQFDGRIKLVLSCKNQEWKRFASHKGSESSLQRALYGSSRSETLVRRRHSASETDLPNWVPSITLMPFTDSERDAALEHYRTAFALDGTFSTSLATSCSDPFMLRMVAEVYHGGTRALPRTADEITLVREYLNQKIEKIDEILDPRGTLTAFAEVLISVQPPFRPKPRPLTSRNWRSSPEPELVPVVDYKALRQKLGNEYLRALRALVSHGLLIETVDDHGRSSFSFYFDRVRDFVVAILVMELDREPDLRGYMSKCMGYRLLEDSLQWYLRGCDNPTQHASAVQYVHERVTVFAEVYNRLRLAFPAGLRTRLFPSCEGPVGVAHWYEPGRWHHTAWLAVENSTSPIVLHDPRLGASERRYTGHPKLLSTAGGTVGFWLARHPKNAAVVAFAEQLAEGIKEGGLDETGREYLLRETILGLVMKEKRALQLSEIEGRTSWADYLLGLTIGSLDLATISTRIQALFGERWYTELWCEKERVRVREESKGKGSDSDVISITIPNEVITEARQRAYDEARNGARFPTFGSHCTTELARRLDSAAQMNWQTIRVPLLPAPDRSRPFIDSSFESAYSDEQLKRLLETVFTRAIHEYEELVRHNFRSMAPRLSLFAKLPVVTVIQCTRATPKAGSLTDAHLWYGIVAIDTGPSRAEAHVNPPQPVFDIARRRISGQSGFAGHPSGCLMISLGSVIGHPDEVAFGHGSYCNVSQFTPVRALVYELLRRDFEHLTSMDLELILDPVSLTA